MSASAFHGLLVIDKPGGMTSRDVVNRVQRWFPRGTRIGHTGTLDPLATGVLIVCIGTATRLVEYVQRMEKTYRAGLLLGAKSDTDDADGTVQGVAVEQPPDLTAIELCVSGFVGEIHQVPPAFSATRVTGCRAYDLARQGHEVSLVPRWVCIHGIDVLSYGYPRLLLEVRCGKGTYIRSLARDVGERLGCGALVETLGRTRVGPFEAATALKLDADSAAARAALLPLSAAVAELPCLRLAAEDLERLRHGQRISVDLREVFAEGNASEAAVFDSRGQLVAVAAVDPQRTLLRPEKVFSLTSTEPRLAGGLS